MLTTLDILVLALICGGLVLGALRGFVAEVLAIFAWFAAIFALKLLHGPASLFLTDVTGSLTSAKVLAFILVFGAAFFGCKLIAREMGRRTRASVLGSVDRLLGAGFGALKGLLAATVGFLAISLVSDMAWAKPSRTYPLLNASGRAVLSFVDKHRARPAASEPGNGTDPSPR